MDVFTVVFGGTLRDIYLALATVAFAGIEAAANLAPDLEAGPMELRKLLGAAVVLVPLARTRLSRLLASSQRRDASFTGSPMTVYWYLSSLPMSPATTSPVDTPIAASNPG